MKNHTHASRRRAGSRHAFTLIETIIATAVFVTLSAGVLSSTVMARRSMNQALMRNTAFDAAQGFLDQIKGGANFTTLLNGMPTPPVPAVPAVPPAIKKINLGNGLIVDVVSKPGTSAIPAVPAKSGVDISVNGIRLGATSATPTSIDLPAWTPGAGDYVPYRLPLNSTDSSDANALAGMSFVPGYGVKLELTRLDDTTVAGNGNAVLVTLRFRYRYQPGAADAPDSEYIHDSVSYIAPRTAL